VGRREARGDGRKDGSRTDGHPPAGHAVHTSRPGPRRQQSAAVPDSPRRGSRPPAAAGTPRSTCRPLPGHRGHKTWRSHSHSHSHGPTPRRRQRQPVQVHSPLISAVRAGLSPSSPCSNNGASSSKLKPDHSRRIRAVPGRRVAQHVAWPWPGHPLCHREPAEQTTPPRSPVLLWLQRASARRPLTGWQPLSQDEGRRPPVRGASMINAKAQTRFVRKLLQRKHVLVSSQPAPSHRGQQRSTAAARCTPKSS